MTKSLFSVNRSFIKRTGSVDVLLCFAQTCDTSAMVVSGGKLAAVLRKQFKGSFALAVSVESSRKHKMRIDDKVLVGI